MEQERGRKGRTEAQVYSVIYLFVCLGSHLLVLMTYAQFSA